AARRPPPRPAWAWRGIGRKSNGFASTPKRMLSARPIPEGRRRRRSDYPPPAPQNRRTTHVGETEGLPLYEAIYRILRRHIVERALPEGLIIGEAALARAFQSG